MNEDGINVCCLQILQQPLCVIQFLIVDDGVDSDIHLGAILMSIGAELCYIFYRITRSHPCPEALCSDIHGISAMINGGDSTFQVLGRSQ